MVRLASGPVPEAPVLKGGFHHLGQWGLRVATLQVPHTDHMPKPQLPLTSGSPDFRLTLPGLGSGSGARLVPHHPRLSIPTDTDTHTRRMMQQNRKKRAVAPAPTKAPTVISDNAALPAEREL